MEEKHTKVLRGVAASPGIVIGKAFVYAAEKLVVTRVGIREDEVEEQIRRFREAVEVTRKEIVAMRERVAREMGDTHARIMDGHLLILEDHSLIDESGERVKRERVNIEYTFSEVVENLARRFAAMEDEYLKERASDIRDVGRRVLRNLQGKQAQDLSKLQEEVIVIAYDLSPSDTAQMRKERVIGFATDVGSRTSHTAIMARSLEIPAVVGLKNIRAQTKAGDTVIVDGNEGTVTIDPPAATLSRYRKRRSRFLVHDRELHKLRDVPAQTLDGHRIQLAANIEFPEELPSAREHGAEGIGLYRTEFFYLNKTELPTEEEHYLAYRNVAEQMSPLPVVIRTLDLGGDKFASQLDMPGEMNPFLGWRAIRFCLERPEIFKVQLRAILRAGEHGNVRVMFPLVSTLEELWRAREMLEEAKQELEQRSILYDKDMEIGVMIETPSAALISEILAKEVDFFSIGTNDLVQYSLAADRVNEKIAHLYQPAHPAVLRLLDIIIKAAHRERIWVGMCGEMAGEPLFTSLLLGMELDQLSMGPMALPAIKRIIRSVTMEEAKKVVGEVMSLTTSEEVERVSRRMMRQISRKPRGVGIHPGKE